MTSEHILNIQRRKEIEYTSTDNLSIKCFSRFPKDNLSTISTGKIKLVAKFWCLDALG